MCFDGNFIQQLSNGNIDKHLIMFNHNDTKRTYITETERDLHYPLFPFPLQVRAHKSSYVACIVDTCVQCTNAHTCVNHHKKSQCCGYYFTQV